MMAKLAIPTAEGFFTAHYSRQGLAKLDFPETESITDRKSSSPAKKSSRPLLGERAGVRASVPSISAPPAEIRRWHKLTTAALNEILAGRQPRNLPPLDLSSGTKFQQSVWGALCRITSGRTLSYAEVAAKVGNPRATRAVGGACGANPIPVLVPCHRVLAAHQALGGFSSGLGWKRKLLAREGIPFR